MNKAAFPVIALVIGAFIQIILKVTITAGEQPAIPLLTLLLMTEFGVIVTVIGVISGGKLLMKQQGFNLKLVLPVAGCAILAVLLGIEGLDLWNYVNSIN